MRILYAIQGTGNGHLSRAHDVIPALHKHGEVDILISGTQADVSIPYPVTYRLKGMSFIFGKTGGVDFLSTILRTNLLRLFNEIRLLPVRHYDLVVNDFEPVSAWAARWRGVPSVSLSHQCALLSESVPRPGVKDILGEAILRYYAPAKIRYGFHFKRYDQLIFTPVIRHQVRNRQISNHGHYTVYLPSYSTSRIVEFLENFPDTRWEVFCKHSSTAFRQGNIHVMPVTGDGFVESMASSAGVLCGAGFETPAEALFMGKKLMVMPMTGQYEQQCNAAALEEMGVPVIRNLHEKYIPLIGQWIEAPEGGRVHYPDITASVIAEMINQFRWGTQPDDLRIERAIHSSC